MELNQILSVVLFLSIGLNLRSFYRLEKARKVLKEVTKETTEVQNKLINLLLNDAASRDSAKEERGVQARGSVDLASVRIIEDR